MIPESNNETEEKNGNIDRYHVLTSSISPMIGEVEDVRIYVWQAYCPHFPWSILYVRHVWTYKEKNWINGERQVEVQQCVTSFFR